jgi:hypothetical protein
MANYRIKRLAPGTQAHRVLGWLIAHPGAHPSTAIAESLALSAAACRTLLSVMLAGGLVARIHVPDARHRVISCWSATLAAPEACLEFERMRQHHRAGSLADVPTASAAADPLPAWLGQSVRAWSWRH